MRWSAGGLIVTTGESRIPVAGMKFLCRKGKMYLEGREKETRTRYKYQKHETILDKTLSKSPAASRISPKC